MDNNDRYQINIHQDPDSPTGVYIPTNLDEVIIEFNRILSVAWKLKLSEESTTDDHFTLEQWVRANWNLDHPPSWVNNLIQAEGITHLENLSTLLIHFYQKYLQNPFHQIQKLQDLSEAHLSTQEEIQRLFNCDRAFLWIIDQSAQEVWTKGRFYDQEIKEIRLPDSFGWTKLVIEARKIINIPFDLYDYPDYRDEIENLKKIDTRIFYRSCSLMGMPIFQDADIRGVLLLRNKIKPGKFLHDNPKIFPQAPECWRSSFTRDDEIFLTRLSQPVINLIN